MTLQRLFPKDGSTIDSRAEPALFPEDVGARLKQQIEARTGRRVQELCVAPRDGRLWVQGRVKTYHVKQLILAAVMDFIAERKLTVGLDICVIA